MRLYEVEFEFRGTGTVQVEAETPESAKDLAGDVWTPDDFMRVWADTCIHPFGRMEEADFTFTTDETHVRTVGGIEDEELVEIGGEG